MKIKANNFLDESERTIMKKLKNENEIEKFTKKLNEILKQKLNENL